MNTIVNRRRTPLPINLTLLIAALISGLCVVAIPAPHQPPGGFANAKPVANESARADVNHAVRTVGNAIGNGVGEVANAFIGGQATTARH